MPMILPPILRRLRHRFGLHRLCAVLPRLLLLGLLGASCAVARAEPEMRLLHAPYRVDDMRSLQNGARLFVNYCLNCHSAQYMRYGKLHALGLSDAQIQTDLMFTARRLADTMTVALTPEQAAKWFGAEPPDLSVIERALGSERGSGADFLYTYLLSFYRDASRPTGWNNLLVPGVAMPNPLWRLQGERAARMRSVADAADPAEHHEVFEGYQELRPGVLPAKRYDSQIADLVAFMQWMAEPAQIERKRIGLVVMLFLAVFTFITWRLKNEYWKDVK